MKKKIIIVFISIILFLLLISITIPLLINKSPKEESKKEFDLSLFAKIKSHIEKYEVEEFLNKDNLYENYSHNYTIKIPENYKYNKGIGKYSSSQFYNENLGFVVAISVGESNFGKKINKEDNNKIINKFPDELKKDKSLGLIFEKSLVETGFNNPKLISYEAINYNNRLFLRLNFNASRISNNEEYPVSITNFITLYKDLVYQFQFVSYQKEPSEKWYSEIQKSMSNVMISEYITKKK